MKASVLPESLLRALNALRAVAPHKSANILIETDSDARRLKMYMGNYEASLRASVYAHIESPGAALARLDVLHELTSCVADVGERIDLEASGSFETPGTTLRFVQHLKNATLLTDEGRGYNDSIKRIIQMPVAHEQPLNASALTLLEAIKRCATYIAKDDNRPILQGVLFELIQDSAWLNVEAANGFCLIRCSVRLAEPSGISLSAAYPGATLLRVSDRLSEAASFAFVDRSDFLPHLDIQDDFLSACLMPIDGKFPDINAAIGTDAGSDILMFRNDTLTTLRLLRPFARESGNAMSIHIDEQGIGTLQAHSQEKGEAQGVQEALEEGDSVQVSFNIEFFLHALQNVRTELFTLRRLSSGAYRIIDTDSPFSSELVVDQVVMPMTDSR